VPRLTPVDPARAEGRSKELLDDVAATFGSTPNLFRTVANSDAALTAMLETFTALRRGTLGPALAEQIAIVVSEVNGCSYCLSAHTAIGRLHKIAADELEANRHARSRDPKTQAALRFAEAVATTRGRISDSEYDELERAGWTDGEIVEILAHVALTTFTNIVAVVAQTDVDFPLVVAGERLAA
jgi:uncharacterized peroxidase-related enzyme